MLLSSIVVAAEVKTETETETEQEKEALFLYRLLVFAIRYVSKLHGAIL